MPDDKTKVGELDRSRVAGDQDYEVRYIAEKYSLTAVETAPARIRNPAKLTAIAFITFFIRGDSLTVLKLPSGCFNFLAVITHTGN